MVGCAVDPLRCGPPAGAGLGIGCQGNGDVEAFAGDEVDTTHGVAGDLETDDKIGGAAGSECGPFVEAPGGVGPGGHDKLWHIPLADGDGSGRVVVECDAHEHEPSVVLAPRRQLSCRHMQRPTGQLDFA